MAAEIAAMTGVEVRSGTAQSQPGRPLVLHAWLSVDGERFDPTWTVLFGKEGQHYKELDNWPCFGVEPEDLTYCGSRGINIGRSV